VLAAAVVISRVGGLGVERSRRSRQRVRSSSSQRCSAGQTANAGDAC
jgi:hypothetical protein